MHKVVDTANAVQRNKYNDLQRPPRLGERRLSEKEELHHL